MIITDWIRAAVAGSTADGREITEGQLGEMASSYAPDVYNARVWPEHIRGLIPDGLFKALGDVTETKVERIKGGALAGRLGFFVRISPLPDLISMVRSGQKVHLSIEMATDFAKTGKAYLMGLGVTDSPASLGTGIMKFSTAGRQENLFSTPTETPLVIPEEHTMTKEEFKELLAAAINPLMERLNAQALELKELKGKQDQVIELATPIAGNGRRPGDREPHGGGDSERTRKFY